MRSHFKIIAFAFVFFTASCKEDAQLNQLIDFTILTQKKWIGLFPWELDNGQIKGNPLSDCSDEFHFF
jgi:hypothetical protein